MIELKRLKKILVKEFVGSALYGGANDPNVIKTPPKRKSGEDSKDKIKLGGKTPVIVNPTMKDTQTAADDQDIKLGKAQSTEVKKESKNLDEISGETITTIIGLSAAGGIVKGLSSAATQVALNKLKSRFAKKKNEIKKDATNDLKEMVVPFLHGVLAKHKFKKTRTEDFQSRTRTHYHSMKTSSKDVMNDIHRHLKQHGFELATPNNNLGYRSYAKHDADVHPGNRMGGPKEMIHVYPHPKGGMKFEHIQRKKIDEASKTKLTNYLDRTDDYKGQTSELSKNKRFQYRTLAFKKLARDPTRLRNPARVHASEETLDENKNKFVVNPAGIASSLEKASKDHAAHEARVSNALSTLPIGHEIKAGKKTFTHITTGGDKFWISNKGKAFSARELYVDVGHKALIPHIGHKTLGLKEETLQEISKKTLLRYRDAAKGDQKEIGHQYMDNLNDPKSDPKKAEKTLHKFGNRTVGINRAERRLTKEDVIKKTLLKKIDLQKQQVNKVRNVKDKTGGSEKNPVEEVQESDILATGAAHLASAIWNRAFGKRKTQKVQLYNKETAKERNDRINKIDSDKVKSNLIDRLKSHKASRTEWEKDWGPGGAKQKELDRTHPPPNNAPYQPHGPGDIDLKKTDTPPQQQKSTISEPPKKGPVHLQKFQFKKKSDTQSSADTKVSGNVPPPSGGKGPAHLQKFQFKKKSEYPQQQQSNTQKHALGQHPNSTKNRFKKSTDYPKTI